MADMTKAAEITAAIESATGPAICAYLTAGFPNLNEFPDVLESVAAAADVVEVGVPFTDPMADGLTIQESSRVALSNGVNLPRILETLASLQLSAPTVLMGYYNPFLVFGLERLGLALDLGGAAGLIIPDLPLEESAPVSAILDSRGLALIQLVSPTTGDDRLRAITAASSGFVYAVTTTGTTGGAAALEPATLEYLDRVRDAASLPVLAGFGVRKRAQVEALAPHVDGVVVGSALIEAIDRGDDPGAFLRGLRPVPIPT